MITSEATALGMYGVSMTILIMIICEVCHLFCLVQMTKYNYVIGSKNDMNEKSQQQGHHVVRVVLAVPNRFDILRGIFYL